MAVEASPLQILGSKVKEESIYDEAENMIKKKLIKIKSSSRMEEEKE